MQRFVEIFPVAAGRVSGLVNDFGDIIKKGVKQNKHRLSDHAAKYFIEKETTP